MPNEVVVNGQQIATAGSWAIRCQQPRTFDMVTIARATDGKKRPGEAMRSSESCPTGAGEVSNLGRSCELTEVMMP